MNPTIIHITVIVAAFVLSTKDGMLVGLVWGLARMVKAYTLPASPLDLLLWTNPIIAVVPRVMVGLVAGLVFHAFLKRKQEKRGMVIAAVLGSLTNTVLVLGFIALFYGNEYATALNVDPSNLLKVSGRHRCNQRNRRSRRSRFDRPIHRKSPDEGQKKISKKTMSLHGSSFLFWILLQYRLDGNHPLMRVGIFRNTHVTIDAPPMP